MVFYAFEVSAGKTAVPVFWSFPELYFWFPQVLRFMERAQVCLPFYFHLAPETDTRQSVSFCRGEGGGELWEKVGVNSQA